MANALKTNGLAELGALRQRITRQYGLQRINSTDWHFLMGKCDQIETRILEMLEFDGEVWR